MDYGEVHKQCPLLHCFFHNSACNSNVSNIFLVSVLLYHLQCMDVYCTGTRCTYVMSSYRICSGEKARKMWSFRNKALRTLLYRYYTCTTWFIFLVCSFPSPILAVSPVTHRTSPKPRSVFFIFIDQFVCLCFLFLKLIFILLFCLSLHRTSIHPFKLFCIVCVLLIKTFVVLLC